MPVIHWDGVTRWQINDVLGGADWAYNSAITTDLPGNPWVIYQGESPAPTLAASGSNWVAFGAGSPGYNGTYYPSGSNYNGKPYYVQTLATAAAAVAEQWTLANLGNRSVAEQWGLSALGNRSLAEQWALARLGSGTLAEQWTLARLGNASLAEQWNLARLAAQAVAEQWELRLTATGAVAEQWVINALANRTLAEQWNLANLVPRSFAEQWNLARLGSGSTALQWTLAQLAAGPPTATATVQTAASLDDARSQGGTWPGATTTYLTATVIYAGATTTNFQAAGMVWEDVLIPPGAKLAPCSVQVQASADNAGSPTFRIYGVAQDDASAFADSTDPQTGNPGSRVRTTAYVEWTVGTWVSGTLYTSPDLSAVLQEITDRPGWLSGNRLGLLIVNASASLPGSNEYRAMVAWDYSTHLYGPRLIYSHVGFPEQWSLAVLGVQSIAEQWILAASAGLSLAELWNLANLGSRSVAEQWAVGNLATSSLAEQWVLAGLAARSVAEQWLLGNTAGLSLAELWELASLPSATLAQLWNLSNLAGLSLAEQWGLASLATRTVAEQWILAALGGRSVAEQWALAGLGGLSLAEQWDLSAKYGRTVAQLWDLAELGAASVAEQWAMWQPIEATLPEQWDIEAYYPPPDSPIWPWDVTPTPPIGGDDIYYVQGHWMQVVEQVHATTSEGWATGWSTEPEWAGRIGVRVQYYEGRPLYTEDLDGRSLFSAFILRDIYEPEWFAVGIYHPSYTHDFISPPQHLEITHTFTTHWRPGAVTIQANGVGIGADHTIALVEELETPEGSHVLRVLPGTYLTNADSEVYWLNIAQGGTPDVLFFPRYRAQDKDWNGEFFPQYVAHLWIYFAGIGPYASNAEGGQRMELIEGQDAVLNQNGASLEITGTEGDTIQIGFMGQPGNLSEHTFGGSGNYVLTGLMPGIYNVICFRKFGIAWDNDYVAKRYKVEVATSGSYSLTCDPLEEAEAGYYTGYVWTEPGVGYGGTLYTIRYTEGEPPPPVEQYFHSFVAVGSCSGGYYKIDGAAVAAIPGSGIWVNDAQWGTIQIATGYGGHDAVLGCYMYGPTTGHDRTWADDKAPSNVHLPIPNYTVEVKSDGLTYRARTDNAFGGWRTQWVVPGFLEQDFTVGQDLTTLASYDYRHWIWYKDGVQWHETTAVPQSLGSNDTSQMYVRAMSPSDATDVVVGGTILGDAWEGGEGDIDEDWVPELYRIGAERGTLAQRAEQLYKVQPEGESSALYGSIDGGRCPWCGAESWQHPDRRAGEATAGEPDYDYPSHQRYGICTACDPGGRDARSFFRSFPLPGAASVEMYHVRIGPNRRRTSVYTQRWYVPAWYQFPVDDSTVGDYGVCTHVVIGTWSAGAWNHPVNTSASGDMGVGLYLESYVNNAVRAYRPKIRVKRAAGAATYRLTVQHLDGSTEQREFPLYGETDSLIFLTEAPFTAAEDWGDSQRNTAWLLADVTNVECVSGDDEGNEFEVIADVPSVVWRRPPVLNQANTPYALPLGGHYKVSGCGMTQDRAGRVWFAWADGSAVYVQYLYGVPATWSAKFTVAQGNYTAADVECRLDGMLIVGAVRENRAYSFYSFDFAASWGEGGLTG